MFEGKKIEKNEWMQNLGVFRETMTLSEKWSVTTLYFEIGTEKS